MIPLETERLILRDFVESDWPAVHQYAADPEGLPQATAEPQRKHREEKKMLNPSVLTYIAVLNHL